MNCELCGKETEPYTALVEGTELKVCEGCSSMGKVLKKPKPPVVKKAKKRISVVREKEVVKEMVSVLVEDFAKRIRTAREKKGMTQKEFASRINEKESILHKMETGGFKPPMPLAKKLEKLLRIKLIEKVEAEEEKIKGPKSKSGALTIGDILKL
jgi:putative transcription factor